MKKLQISSEEYIVVDNDKVFLTTDTTSREITWNDVDEIFYAYEIPIVLMYELYE
jgi:hypothetical protein